MVDLDTRDQLLGLNLSFRELGEVVAHRRVVPEVDLRDNEDEGNDIHKVGVKNDVTRIRCDKLRDLGCFDSKLLSTEDPQQRKICRISLHHPRRLLQRRLFRRRLPPRRCYQSRNLKQEECRHGPAVAHCYI